MAPENRNGSGWQPGESGNPDTQFTKGKSGNPGGRPKGLAAYVRERAPAQELADWQWAIWRKDEVELAKLGIDPDKVTLEERQKAHQWLTERGHGKAPTYAPVVEADPLDRNQIDAAIDEAMDELAGRRQEKAPRKAPNRDVADTG